MALLKYTQDETSYVEVDGKLYCVKYRECYGKNQKPFVRFSVAYDYEVDDFGSKKNKYISCTAWGNIAEIVNYLSEQNRLQVKVSGKIEESEWQGEKRENLTVTFIEPLFEIPIGGKAKKKDEETAWDEAETEYSD